MKLRNFFYLLIALPLAFASCENFGEDVAKEVKLTVTSSLTAEFEAEGGAGIIVYTLENAPEGAQVSATCAAEWVNNITVGTNITYMVDANSTEEARETKVVVSYEAQVVEVVVMQAGKAAAPKTPKFELVSAEEMEFGWEQALGSIEFNLENPVEGVSVSVSANQSWVSDFKVTDNTIEFVVAENLGEARNATITATYGVFTFSVKVSQSEYVAPDPVIYIDSANTEFEAEGGNGEIAFRVENTVEGVEATATTNADWITITSCADGIVAYTVAANETDSLREEAIVITYGTITEEVKIMQYMPGYNPNLEYVVFGVTECWATSENGGKQWDVIFVEHDTTLGDMQTRISFALAEANTQRVSDGTYSVENGGILLNTAVMNGLSTYRHNCSESVDITDATFTVSTNTDAKVITIEGTFLAGNKSVDIKYRGQMDGMDLGEAVVGAIEHTEWASVKKNWHENAELLFTAVSADGSLTAVFDFYDYDSSKALAAGEYEVTEWYSGINTPHLRATSYFKYNGVECKLTSGSATVEHIAGGYKITYNIVDELGREFTGVIEGEIDGAVNPA